MSNAVNTPGGSAKEGPHVRGGSELGSDLMNVYRGFWLWEGRFVVFYKGLRLLGGRMSNAVSTPSGSSKEGPHVRGGSELGSYEDSMNVWGILALGGFIFGVLRGSDVLGVLSF